MTYWEDINLELNTNTAYVVVGAKQGDNARGVRIHLFQNGTPRSISSGATAEYRIHKPDGTSIWDEANIEGDIIKVVFSSNALAAPGRGYADIILHETADNGVTETLSTASFILLIQASPDVTLGLKSTDQFTAVINTIQNGLNLINESEAWAVGKRNGKDVEGIDSASFEVGPDEVVPQFLEGGEQLFRDHFGIHPGMKTYYAFEKISNSWYVNGIKLETNLADVGITNVKEGLESFTVIITDKDNTYNNNSKYYATQAGSSASLAVASASLAIASANTAISSAAQASDDAKLAKFWAVGNMDTTSSYAGFVRAGATWYDSTSASASISGSVTFGRRVYAAAEPSWYYYNTSGEPSRRYVQSSAVETEWVKGNSKFWADKIASMSLTTETLTTGNASVSIRDEEGQLYLDFRIPAGNTIVPKGAYSTAVPSYKQLDLVYYESNGMVQSYVARQNVDQTESAHTPDDPDYWQPYGATGISSVDGVGVTTNPYNVQLNSVRYDGVASDYLNNQQQTFVRQSIGLNAADSAAISSILNGADIGEDHLPDYITVSGLNQLYQGIAMPSIEAAIASLNDTVAAMSVTLDGKAPINKPSFTGAATFSGSVTLNEGNNLHLIVDQPAYFHRNLSIGPPGQGGNNYIQVLNVAGDDPNLKVNIPATFTNTLNVTGALSVAGAFSATGTFLAKNLDVSGTLSAKNLNATGLTVTSNATLSILTVNNAASLKNLSVSSISTFGGDVIFNGKISATSAVATFTRLDVAAKSTFGGNLEIKGSVDLTGETTRVSNPSFSVKIPTTFTERVTINNDFSVPNNVGTFHNIHATAYSTFDGYLDVAGRVMFTGKEGQNYRFTSNIPAVFNQQATLNTIVLTSAAYGTATPSTGTVGQIFFVRA